MGSQSAEFSTVASRTDGKVLFHCCLEAKTMSDPDVATTQVKGPPKRLCYHVEWKPDLDLMTKAQIESYCSSWGAPPLDLDRLMLLEKDILYRLALNNVEKSIDEQAIIDGSSHLGYYLDWMNNRVLSNVLDVDVHSLAKDYNLEELQNRVENVDPMGKLLVRVTRNLRDVLDGKFDALQLLFEDTLMNEHYCYSNQVATAFRNLGLYVDLLAHKRPNLNFLEIDAGTESATQDILRVLTQNDIERFSEYTFTDISASFFERAKEDFRDCADRMTFLPLNIEKDPLQQGFTAKYDVIIASNVGLDHPNPRELADGPMPWVLHATTSLMDTLQNARRLLKRGSKIIMFESVNPNSINTTFVFGLLPGWWHGTEDIRRWGPLVSEDAWHSLLQATGFSVADVSFRNSAGNSLDEASIMIGTALDEPVEAPQYPHVVILDEGVLDNLRPDKTRTSLIHQLHHTITKEYGVECEVLSDFSTVPKDLGNTTFILISSDHSMGLVGLSAHKYANLQKLVKSAAGLLWVFGSNHDTRSDPVSETITGFLRCMQSEHERLKVVSLHTSMQAPGISSVADIVKVFQQ
ncbi:MAG: hypothetical protein Q9181_006419 [Wetmoreana brouardii]